MQINKKETGSLRLSIIAFFTVKHMDCSKQNTSLFTMLIICAMGMRELGFFTNLIF